MNPIVQTALKNSLAKNAMKFKWYCEVLLLLFLTYVGEANTVFFLKSAPPPKSAPLFFS